MTVKRWFSKNLFKEVRQSKKSQWAKEHKNWTIEAWKEDWWIEFLEVFGHNNIFCSILSVRANSKAWEQIITVKLSLRQKKSDVIQINSILNKGEYLTFYVITFNLHLCTIIILNTNYLNQLQSDNPPKIIKWPPQSPDLKLIEKLWDELDRQVRKYCPTSKTELWNILQREWNNIPVENSFIKFTARTEKLHFSMKRKYEHFFNYFYNIFLCSVLSLVHILYFWKKIFVHIFQRLFRIFFFFLDFDASVPWLVSESVDACNFSRVIFYDACAS